MQIIIIRYFIRIALLSLIFLFKNWVRKAGVFPDSWIPTLQGLSNYLLLLILINIVTAILIMIYRLRKKIPYKYSDNVINGINNVYYLVVTALALLMFLELWGINYKELITSLSIVAAAIAIISKEYVSTVISGIIISFSKDINIDDYVKIGENKGKIIDINLTKVTLKNDDDDIIYIPNDKVYMSEFINYTKKEIKKVSIDFELALKNISSIEELEQKIEETILEFEQYIEPKSYNLKVVEMHHDHLALKFQFRLNQINPEVEKSIRKKIIRYIAGNITKNK